MNSQWFRRPIKHMKISINPITITRHIVCFYGIADKYLGAKLSFLWPSNSTLSRLENSFHGNVIPPLQPAGQHSLPKNLFNHQVVHADFVCCHCQFVKHHRIDRLDRFCTILKPTITRYRDQIYVFLTFNVHALSIFHDLMEQTHIPSKKNYPIRSCTLKLWTQRYLSKAVFEWVPMDWIIECTYFWSERGRNELKMEWEGIDIMSGERRKSGEFWWL